MLFAIRDDDTSYFTKPEELRKAYDFVKEGIISLSVVYNTVPIHKDNVFPYGENLEYKLYTIENNHSLIEYLIKNNKKYSLLLHGYSHEYKKINGKWFAEMKWKDKKRLEKELTLAKNKLEEIFLTKLEVFVAPNNSIDKNAISVIENLKMNYSGIILHKDREINLKYLINYIKRWSTRLIYRVQYPGILDYGKHKELAAYTLDNFERLKYEYHYCKSKKVPFIVYTHYWQLNQDIDKKKLLKKIYDYVISDGAKLVSLNDCFKRS